MRVGIRQRAAEVALASPGGLQVQGVGGGLLLEARRAVTLRSAGPEPQTPGPSGVGTGGQDPAASEMLEREQPPAGAAPGERESAPPSPPRGRGGPEPRGSGCRLAVTDADGGPALVLPFSALRIVSREAGITIELGKVRYRGAVEVSADARGRLTAVNVLSVEDYLRGVLPAEMPPSAPAEALKAQAIVARTFTLSARGRHGAGGFDVCDGTHCQVYGGAGREREATDRAVRETRGRVLRAAGKLMPAYFHSACGGATDSPEDVWGGGSGTADPGLRIAGVEDAPAPLGEDFTREPSLLAMAVRGPEVFCGDAREFSWEFERTRAELERTLARTLPGVLGKPVRLGVLQALEVTGRTRFGRVRSLEVRGSAGSATLRGESIRWAFNSGRPEGPALPSTRFVVRPIRGPGTREGEPPERYRFYGFGSGHGVGLCQAGAIGMARRCCDAARILAHYFPGAAIEPMEGARP